jgi:tetratricopeptide (TPR) repeat protein
MKIRTVAAAVAGLLMMALPSFAQITVIEGKVTGVDGKPLQGAVIRIVRTDVDGTFRVKSDKKGHYVDSTLIFGVYDVYCEVDGKVVDKVAGIHTSTQNNQTVDFNLKAKAAIQEAATTGALSKEQARSMSPEEKQRLEETYKKNAESRKKNSALNEAYNAGKTALDAGIAADQLAKTQTGADRDASIDKARTQYGAAIESFTKASELDPKQGAVWSGLAQAYEALAKDKTDADANLQKSAENWAKAIEITPEEPGLHNNYALVLAQCKKFPEAQAELEKAVTINPGNAGQYYYNLGALEINAGQNDAASETFKKAVAVVPPYPEAFYQYGITLVGKATYDKDGKIIAVPGTVEAFQKYLDLTPNGPHAQEAKDMLTTLGSTLQVQYKNPDAGKKTKKTTTSK